MDFVQQWIVPPEAVVRDPFLYIPLAVVALLLGAVSKGGFGGGVGILSMPLMFLLLPAPFAITLWVPVLVACDLATINRYPREWAPHICWRLAPGTFLGLLAANLFLFSLRTAPDQSGALARARVEELEAWLKIMVALICCVFVVLQLRPARTSESAWQPNWPTSLGVGLITGITTTFAHAAGPVTTMYLLPQKLEPRVFVGTMGRFFLAVNSSKIPFLLAIGWFTWPVVRYALWLVVLAPLGVLLGSWLNRRLSPVLFVRIVHLCLLVTAGKLVYDAIRTVLSH